MKIKNWNKYQHYKDRNPPWIKLHRKLLDDREFHKLKPLASKVLVLCWLLAAEDEKQEGNLPSVEDISFRLRIPEKDIKASILELNQWIESDSSTLLAECKQDATPETETETEIETEKKNLQKKESRASKPTLLEVIDYFREKNSSKTEAENFFDFYESKGWKVGKTPMKKWRSAASGWIRRNQSQQNNPRNINWDNVFGEENAQ